MLTNVEYLITYVCDQTPRIVWFDVVFTPAAVPSVPGNFFFNQQFRNSQDS